MDRIKTLLLFIVISFLPGVFGGLFTGPSINTWYATLVKPALNPPNWVFGPVWVLLYIFMGVAAYLVWRDGKQGKVLALSIFLVHLVINGLWSYIFFGMQSIIGGFIVIVILLSLISILFVLFKRHSTWSAALLIPYFMWVAFAIYLNTMLLVLN